MTDWFMQNVRLLLRDLSTRLPYGVVCEACGGHMRSDRLANIDVADWDEDVRPLCDIVVNEETLETDSHEIDDLRPYLYPMSMLDQYIYVGGERFMPLQRIAEIHARQEPEPFKFTRTEIVKDENTGEICVNVYAKEIYCDNSEQEAFITLWNKKNFDPALMNVALTDFCVENHLDYRGLIDIGWAVEVTEENNPYKTKEG